jgi:aspartyl-tRNA synthetase
MNTYGTDKPDLRFSMELHELNSVFRDSSFPPLKKAATDPDMTVHGIVIPEGGLWSRKLLDELGTFPERFNGETLSWIAFRDNEMRSSNAKRILNEESITGIKDCTQCGPDDLVLFAGGNWHKTVVFLGRIRTYMGKKLELIDQSLLAFLFVVDFPQFEWNEDEQRLDPVHHMFVLPKEDSVRFLESNPLSVLSTQVDAVCNGYELCSGSLRNHRRELQEKIMRLIGISEEDAETKFGHLLNALEYGAPPHGGAAPGLDRLLMVLLNTERMSDVVVFPKTYSGRDLLMDAPSDVSVDQLHDLHLSIIESERTEA